MPFALKALAKAGLVVGATLTLIGLLARWFPALDIVNNGLPFLLVGTLIVAILAALARSGLLTVLAAVALRAAGGSVIAGMAAGPGLPAILADLFRRTAMTGVTSTLRLVGLHGGIALLTGVAVFGVAWPLARRAERLAPARAAATRAEARTRILPIEHPHDEGDPPSGMFG